MIRVNLLGAKEAVRQERVAVQGPPSEKGGAFFGILIVGGALAFIGFQYWSATKTIADLDRETRYLTEEKARLAAIIAQVQEYERKNQRYEEKEKLIERLKNEREGPVHMLDEISAQLPDFIWITNLSQSASSVTIDGMAASYVSIADYIRKLEDTAYFRNVELVDAQQDKEFTKFQLRSEMVAPTPAAGIAAAPPAGSN